MQQLEKKNRKMEKGKKKKKEKRRETYNDFGNASSQMIVIVKIDPCRSPACFQIYARVSEKMQQRFVHREGGLFGPQCNAAGFAAHSMRELAGLSGLYYIVYTTSRQLVPRPFRPSRQLVPSSPRACQALRSTAPLRMLGLEKNRLKDLIM